MKMDERVKLMLVIAMLIGISLMIYSSFTLEKANSQEEEYNCTVTYLTSDEAYWWNYVVCELPDGRKVECIRYKSIDTGGLSCNWKELE